MSDSVIRVGEMSQVWESVEALGGAVGKQSEAIGALVGAFQAQGEELARLRALVEPVEESGE